MRVIYLDWPCFSRNDAFKTLQNLFGDVTKFYHDDYREYESDAFKTAFSNFVKNKTGVNDKTFVNDKTSVNSKRFDLLFSYNYHPIVSECCMEHDITYVSLVYDNPHITLYSPTIFNECNRIYIFDSGMVDELKTLGAKNIYYMPLPANADTIGKMLLKPYDRARTTCDVSFVGALYNESDDFFDKIYPSLNNYEKGYLDAIISSQLNIQGANLIESCLNDELINHCKNIYNCTLDKPQLASDKYIYADYVINKKITSLERMKLIHLVGNHFDTKLFTLDEKNQIGNSKNMGICDYYNEMPYVFYNSKINLNITLRSIKKGIPLRAIDIMACGGFLLTNYQEDMLKHFIPGEDFDYYVDNDDLLNKIDYYLTNENIRKEIAMNGHRKIKENFSFKKIFSEMFKEFL